MVLSLITVDDVGSLTTPKSMIQAIDTNFDATKVIADANEEAIEDLQAPVLDGPAYWFDGVDDYVNIIDNDDIVTDDSMSFSFLISSAVDGSWDTLLDRRDADNDGFVISLYSDGQIWAQYNDIDTKTTNCNLVAGTLSIITVVVDVTDTMKIFQNGVECICSGQTSIAGETIDVATTNLPLGKSFNGFKFFSGSMYEIRSFNMALDPTDATDLAIINGGEVPFKYQGASQTALTSGTLIAGKEYIIDTFMAGDDFVNIGGTNVTGNVFVATGTTPTTWTNSSSLRQIGCVLDLNKNGVGINTWADQSGNSLHGAVSGAIPFNLPVNHTEKYIDLVVTGDTSFTLPKDYIIDAIVLESDGAIGGGIDVGTTNGGGEIVTAQTVSGAGKVLCTLVAGANYNLTGADDTIYITDADGTGWDSATVSVTVKMSRMEV
jgi:hypothetical protein